MTELVVVIFFSHICSTSRSQWRHPVSFGADTFQSGVEAVYLCVTVLTLYFCFNLGLLETQSIRLPEETVF